MPTYLSGDTDADDTQAEEANPEEASSDVRYDLAGNPLPRSARPPAAPALGDPLSSEPSPVRANFVRAAPSSLPFSALPPSWPDSGGPVWTPPPGYTSPPGFPSAPPPKAAVSDVSGTQLYAALGMVVVGIVALTFALHSLKPNMVAAPAAYTPYTALDSSFTCEAPRSKEWKIKEAGTPGGDHASATFASGKVTVHVVSDTTGSLMADISSNPAQTKPAVQRLHERDEQEFQADLPHYAEKDAQPFQSKFGDARVSEWTAFQGNIKLHGYRVTMLGKEREVSVFCLSPERNWAAMMPTFQHIIESVGPGSG